MQAFSFSGDRSQIVANHNRIKPSRRICQMVGRKVGVTFHH